MSHLRLCPSCEELHFDKPVLNTKKADWLKEFDFVQDFISKTSLVQHKEYRFNIKKKIYIDKKKEGRLVLFWASEPGSSYIILNARDAYKDFKNYGVAKIDESGYITIHLRTPQNYKITSDNGETEFFFRHFHYIISDTKNMKWINNKVFTQLLLGYYNLTQVMEAIRSKMVIVLNSLDYKYYAIDHIPGTFSLPCSEIKKMTAEDLQDFIRDVIQINYYPIQKKIDKEHFDIKHVPIIIYCAKDSCNSSDKCAEEFTMRGFVNISTFPGGMEKYHQSQNKRFQRPIYSQNKSLKNKSKSNLKSTNKK